GLFALVRTSYSLKFLWSPLIDRMPIPFLTARLGRRRSWALVIQFLLALAILALGMTDPRVDAVATALAAVVVAFLSASQDIVIDAYRIELLRPDEQGAGAGAALCGSPMSATRWPPQGRRGSMARSNSPRWTSRRSRRSMGSSRRSLGSRPAVCWRRGSACFARC